MLARSIWEQHVESEYMSKRKRKLTAAEKLVKKKRWEEFEWVFINGKQKRVRRGPAINGMDAGEWIRKYADPVWLVQNEMWEVLYEREMESRSTNGEEDSDNKESGLREIFDD
jgi:hypothetical protein